MTVNRLHVSYSERYRSYVITDSHGSQIFTNDGRPMVFTTYAAALDTIR